MHHRRQTYRSSSSKMNPISPQAYQRRCEKLLAVDTRQMARTASEDTESIRRHVLDWMLPLLMGGRMQRLEKEEDSRTPLKARDQTSDRVRGLDSGADDYLGKPFDLPSCGRRAPAAARVTWDGRR